MSIAPDRREERAHVRALAALMNHVGACPSCAEEVRRRNCPHGRTRFNETPPSGPISEEQITAACRIRCNGVIRQENRRDAFCIANIGHDGPCDEGCHCCGHPLLSGGVNATTGWCLECSSEAKFVLDLSDASTPLCARGIKIREEAMEARACTPAERLVSHWGLESPDVPPTDAHDCARAAAWLRGDPGEARSILDRLVQGAGPLEERDEPTPELRAAFLAGFRRRFPSRGPVPTEEQKARRAAAADRICALVAERYENRHRGPAPPEALEAFRRSHDVWVMGDGPGDLERMAADAERFRAEHPGRWAARALLPPKDPLNELKKIARWIAEGLIQEEASRG